ncbi:MAG: peptidoglycan DD-metalloendopeptidase family protein, partial [Hymenobacteraceae bacterium]|nr:peptidoglycan DD-metalloendopeptidase family protein [Hymenobacteraceae bacterium]MDX5397858.1 peptidoglycan DD-metalloendopeptidase family protein [Hymenobacteraceae bacterium]MDX5513930.1 peptidoglycan DD-metalloendopeptidase family protein [Hymenobacteraceae bacterium]
MSAASVISDLLTRHTHEIGPLLNLDVNSDKICVLDLSHHNHNISVDHLQDTAAFDVLIHQLMERQNANVGLGGYLEDRKIYERSTLFEGSDQYRSIHLGVDIWADAGTEVLAPLDGKVHSFRDNNNFGDYGPTLILEHQLEKKKFYTLYGHLSRSSLIGLVEDNVFRKGERIGWIGNYPENGNWPPHLHFQIITDMEGRKGDFPGVVA